MLLESGAGNNNPVSPQKEKTIGRDQNTMVLPQTRILPNPVTDRIRVMLSYRRTVERVVLRNLTGKMVLERLAPVGEFTWEVSSLSSGMYFATIRYFDGAEETHRIVKL